MSNERAPLSSHQNDLVELTHVQPIEAEMIVARLHASGIEAAPGAGSVYESLSFADGVPVYVPAEDASRAMALLEGQGGPD